jgi:L-ascorbate metabolism protein UlaG (beta-lactamase superfamily)
MQDQFIRPSHHTENGFRNPYPGFENRGFKDFLKWQRDRRNGKAPPKPQQYHFSIIANNGGLLRTNREHFTVTWIGHSTTLIQIAGRNILTDPIFSERCSPIPWSGPKRVVPPSPQLGHLPRVDFVLLSHDHYDHLDKPTIKKLGNQPLYIRNATLWCSWAVIGKQERLYFGGDSGYFPGFKEIGEKFERCDLVHLGKINEAFVK